MSTANIVSITPFLGGVTVTFQTRDGGEISYTYYGSDAAAILAGDDPANYDGERGGAPDVLDDEGIAGATDIADISELGELL